MIRRRILVWGPGTDLSFTEPHKLVAMASDATGWCESCFATVHHPWRTCPLDRSCHARLCWSKECGSQWKHVCHSDPPLFWLQCPVSQVWLTATAYRRDSEWVPVMSFSQPPEDMWSLEEEEEIPISRLVDAFDEENDCILPFWNTSANVLGPSKGCSESSGLSLPDEPMMDATSQ
jgi:hypothetical protein